MGLFSPQPLPAALINCCSMGSTTLIMQILPEVGSITYTLPGLIQSSAQPIYITELGQVSILVMRVINGGSESCFISASGIAQKAS